MNSKEAIQELYNEREYLLGEKVNNKTKNWYNDITHYDNIGHCLLTIREDLDRLEKENKEFKENSKEICECDVDRLNKIDKDLKALEIIKEQGFLFVEKGQLYCGRYGDIEVLLEEDDFEDKHEYELLKEVFGNGI